LVERYRALFPEDLGVREVERHLNDTGSANPLTAPGRSPQVPLPR
jgi:hypothetical protein